MVNVVSKGMIRPARLGEGSQLTAMIMESKAYWGYDKAFMESCRDELTIDDDYITRATTFVFVDDKPRAFAGFTVTDTPVEVDYLFVSPDCIGQGIGRRLFTALTQEAVALGIEKLMIASDPGARGFYESMGAIRIGDIESGSIKGRTLPLLQLSLVSTLASS